MKLNYAKATGSQVIKACKAGVITCWFGFFFDSGLVDDGNNFVVITGYLMEFSFHQIISCGLAWETVLFFTFMREKQVKGLMVLVNKLIEKLFE